MTIGLVPEVAVVLLLLLLQLLVLLLPGPRVLKPDLGDPLGQARNLGDPLEILPIRVTVDLEVGLQHLHLLLTESRSYPLRLFRR